MSLFLVVMLCFLFYVSLCVCVWWFGVFFARGAAEEEQRLRRVGLSTGRFARSSGFSGCLCSSWAEASTSASAKVPL